MEQVIVQEVTKLEMEMAQECIECSLCRCGNEKQKRLPLWFLNGIEHQCPCGKAHEKVYGHKAHERRSGNATCVV